MDTKQDSFRIHSLDGIRGYAALTVVLYHCMLSLDAQIWHRYDDVSILRIQDAWGVFSKILLVVFNGDAAVILFFIMSGFVLSRSLINDLHKYDIFRTIISFLIRRLLRLYPAFIVLLFGTIAILSLVFYIFSIPFSEFYFTKQNLINNALLLSPEISGITWSILVEFAAIPYIIVFCYLLFRFGYLYTVIFIVVALLARKFNVITFNYLKFHLYILCFAFGLLMASTVGRYASRLLSKINCSVALGAFMAVSFFAANTIIQVVLGYVFLSSLIVSDGKLNAIMSNSVSSYLGRISYGIYLWHYPFVVALYTPFAIYAPFALGDKAIIYGLMMAPLIILVTIGLAHLSERFIERPFIVMGYKLSRAIQRPKPPKQGH